MSVSPAQRWAGWGPGEGAAAPAVTRGRAEPVKPLGGDAGTPGPAPHQHDPVWGTDTEPDTQPNTNRTEPGRAGPGRAFPAPQSPRGPRRGLAFTRAPPVPKGCRDRHRDRPAPAAGAPEGRGRAQRPPRAAQGPRPDSGPGSLTMMEPPPPPRLGPGTAPEALGARGGAAPETLPGPSTNSGPSQTPPKLPRPLPGTGRGP